MKYWIAVIAISLSLFSNIAATADKQVKGYTKNNGTYVAPHYKTKSNSTRADNYSSKPNVNPYTGKSGYVDPYAPKKKIKPN